MIMIVLNAMSVKVSADEKTQNHNATELLVLIDNSGSVKENDQGEKELDWAENICAHAHGAGVVLKYIWFDDEKW